MNWIESPPGPRRYHAGEICHRHGARRRYAGAVPARPLAVDCWPAPRRRRHWAAHAGRPRPQPADRLFADLGKLLLMCFAGLEFDLARFRQAKRRTAIFGVLTTCLPPAARYRHRPAVRLRPDRGDPALLSARLGHPRRRPNHQPHRRQSPGADHRHLQRDDALRHAPLTRRS